jgi:hypothetical protein
MPSTHHHAPFRRRRAQVEKEREGVARVFVLFHFVLMPFLLKSEREEYFEKEIDGLDVLGGD